MTRWPCGQNARLKVSPAATDQPRVPTRGWAGTAGFDYGDGQYVLPALRQTPQSPRRYLIDRSGSRRVRFGVDLERDRKALTR